MDFFFLCDYNTEFSSSHLKITARQQTASFAGSLVTINVWSLLGSEFRDFLNALSASPACSLIVIYLCVLNINLLIFMFLM